MTDELLAYGPLEAAKLISCSKNLIYQMIETGQIKSIRCGTSRKKILVPAWAIQEFLKTATAGGNSEQ